MLGVCLLYVGAVLINNGYCALADEDGTDAVISWIKKDVSLENIG